MTLVQIIYFLEAATAHNSLNFPGHVNRDVLKRSISPLPHSLRSFCLITLIKEFNVAI
jgi:hypothetical protein